ncbi:MAG: hypothetical protein PVJ57_21730 [Phycisphaerae bacterium]|jgi:hypothetical protein
MIASNSAVYGGAVRCSDSDAVLTNCTIAANSAEHGGIIDCENSAPVLANCTVASNVTTSSNSAGIDCWASQPTLNNCIIWDNGETPAKLAGGSDLYVTFSDFEDGWSGAGNIDEDPLFVDPENDDFHLSPDSPCIDAGDPAFVPSPGDADLDGEYRVWDGDEDDVAIVDMGADEFGSYVFGDLNCDGAIDNFDIRAFVLAITDPEAYAERYPNCNAALGDLTGDGLVNNFDISPFIQLLSSP